MILKDVNKILNEVKVILKENIRLREENKKLKELVEKKTNKKEYDGLKSELYKLAAQIAMCHNMPSTYINDWTFPKGLQITAWRKVYDSSAKAERQCKDWATKLRQIIDVLEKRTK